MSRWRRFRDFLGQSFHVLFWDDFREGLIDLQPVRWDVRTLTILGGGVMVITLLATLLFGHGFALTREVPFEAEEIDASLTIPTLALVLATLVFALGWAYLLGGAARCSLWVFFVAEFLFAIQTLILANALIQSEMAVLLYTLNLAVLAVLGLGGYLIFEALRPRWGIIGLLEGGWWFGQTVPFIILIWLTGESPGAVATNFGISVGLITIVVAFYWFYLSIDVIDMGAALAKWFVGGTRILLPPGPARWLIGLFLCFKPFVAFGLFGLTRLQFMAVDMFASLLLLLALLVLLALRRYSRTAAYVLLSLSILLTFAAYMLDLAAAGSDLSSLLLQKVGLVSPVVSFVVLTLWDIAASGARFANGDGKHFPQEGRVLLYVGGLMLAATLTLFYTASGNPILENLINDTLLGGLGTLGLLYIIFIVWRQRAALIGPPVKSEEGLSQLRQLSPTSWRVLILLAGLLMACLCSVLIISAAFLWS